MKTKMTKMTKKMMMKMMMKKKIELMEKEITNTQMEKASYRHNAVFFSHNLYQDEGVGLLATLLTTMKMKKILKKSHNTLTMMTMMTLMTKKKKKKIWLI